MLLLPIPWVANAAGLGRLAVLSSLGQPFRAEIDLVSHQAELPTLSTRIASPDAYKQADLQYSPALAGSHLDVKKQPNGRAYIEVTSRHPVNDLFIDLLIELTWGSNRLVRAYTALIDLPDFGPVPITSARFAVPDAQLASGPQSAVGPSTATHVEEKPAALKRKIAARLFKGDRPKPGAADPGEMLIMSRRIKILEEKSILGAEALAGLIGRITLLEDAVQRMRRLLETKSAGTAAPRERAGGDPPAQESDTAKSEVVAAIVKEKAAVEIAASVDIKKETPKAVSPVESPAARTTPEKPKSASLPRPSPESSPVGTKVSAKLYLAVAGGVILLGGLALWMWRRRKLQEVVTPENILIKLLARNPGRDDLQLKLLEIYFAREDRAAFHRAAVIFNNLTGGQGEDWRKVAAMGNALDPGNPLYEADKDENSAAAAKPEGEQNQ